MCHCMRSIINSYKCLQSVSRMCHCIRSITNSYTCLENVSRMCHCMLSIPKSYTFLPKYQASKQYHYRNGVCMRENTLTKMNTKGKHAELISDKSVMTGHILKVPNEAVQCRTTKLHTNQNWWRYINCLPDKFRAHELIKKMIASKGRATQHGRSLD